MSFNVWVGFVGNGDIVKMPRARIEKAFAGLMERREEGEWNLIDSIANVSFGEEPEIGCFGVGAPPGLDHPFWPALLRLMQEIPSVFFWPGGGCVVADKSAAKLMPPDMLEDLGEPFLATKPEDFFAHIK